MPGVKCICSTGIDVGVTADVSANCASRHVEFSRLFSVRLTPSFLVDLRAHHQVEDEVALRGERVVVVAGAIADAARRAATMKLAPWMNVTPPWPITFGASASALPLPALCTNGECARLDVRVELQPRPWVPRALEVDAVAPRRARRLGAALVAAPHQLGVEVQVPEVGRDPRVRQVARAHAGLGAERAGERAVAAASRRCCARRCE